MTQYLLVEWQEITSSYTDPAYAGVSYIQIINRRGAHMHLSPSQSSQKRVERLMQQQALMQYYEHCWESAGDDIWDRSWEYNPAWYNKPAEGE